MKKFELTKDHLKLLQGMEVCWDAGEYGAPAIDCKKPYGNSYVEEDIANILGWKLKNRHGEEELSDEQELLAQKLHQEMEFVLQICLQTLSFKEGIYKRENEWSKWKLKAN